MLAECNKDVSSFENNSKLQSYCTIPTRCFKEKEIESQYLEVVGTIFISSNYRKCKLICTFGNSDVQRVPTTVIRFERKFLIEIDY